MYQNAFIDIQYILVVMDQMRIWRHLQFCMFMTFVQHFDISFLLHDFSEFKLYICWFCVIEREHS